MFYSYLLSVDIADSPSVTSVGCVVCPGSVVSAGSEWSDTVAVPNVGRIVSPEEKIMVHTILLNYL